MLAPIFIIRDVKKIEQNFDSQNKYIYTHMYVRTRLLDYYTDYTHTKIDFSDFPIFFSVKVPDLLSIFT